MAPRILGVAGWAGSGKTTLLERVLPTLAGGGLAVAVVKHDVHGLADGPPGKDSERLRRAGADVFAVGPGEALARWSSDAGGDPAPLLAELERRYDLVLVEGYKGSAIAKVWLQRQGEDEVPAAARAVVATLAWDDDRPAAFVDLARTRLTQAWDAAPRRAAVLVGGASRRMGRRKEGLAWGAGTLLDHVATALAAGGAGPLTLLGSPPTGTPAPGAGPAGGPGGETPRLPDVPGIRGPLAALLAALRWAPLTWTVAPCDLPRLDAAAVAWLLAQRAPGRWGVLPRVDGEIQPLLAVYEPQALPLLEALARSGPPAPSRLGGLPRIHSPEPPLELRAAWRGVNTPEELAAVRPPAG